MDTYTTRTEAIYAEIITPLGEYHREHDIEAIADAVLVTVLVDGEYRWACKVSTDEFWAIAEANALTAKQAVYFDLDHDHLRDAEGQFMTLEQLGQLVSEDGAVTVMKWYAQRG